MKPRLMIILPCYNEAGILPQTVPAIGSLLDSLIKEGCISAESRACFVNDGSTDDTWRLIEEACRSNPNFSALKLSRNFGHQGAILAGMFNTDADFYVTIDADLQDDPGCIRLMLDQAAKGAEIVYGVRDNRSSDSFFKKHTAQLFYKFMQLLGVNIIYNHADYRLMSRRVVETLREYPERNLFLRAVMPLLGYQTACVYYQRRPRQAGATKYPLSKMIALAWNGISGFSIVPLRIVTFLGLFICLLSLFFLIYLFCRWSAGGTIVGWASLVTIITIFSGVQLLSLGIIGEYIAKIFIEVKHRPLFIVDEKIGLD